MDIYGGHKIRLYTIPKDTLKTDYLLLTFTLPLEQDTIAKYALLPSVLSQGSRQYPTQRDFARQLDTLYNAEIGCRTGKCGDNCMVLFWLRCLEQPCVPDGEDLFSETVSVLTELLFHPITEGDGFYRVFVEREKQNLCDTIRAQINNKAAYAMARLESEMCKEEPYGIPGRGTLADVACVTSENLYHAYRDMLCHAPAALYYVGKLSEDAVSQKLSPLFSALDAQRCAPYYTTEANVIRCAEHPPRFIEEEQSAKQSRLCIGYRSGAALSDGDFYRFALFNELFGGSAVSKLFLEVREERGLCYDCSSFPEAQKGLLFVSCGISADDFEEAKAAIDAQLDAIRQGNITDAEFAAAKQSLIAGYREIEDSGASLAFWYANRLYAGIATSPDETAAQVEQCTIADMIACAQRVTEDTVYFMRGTAEDMETEGESDDDTDGNAD